MARQTKEEKFELIKKIGIEINTDFEISDQAKVIIEKIDDFPVDHFKQWFKNNYGTIHGTHMLHYLNDAKGISDSKK